MQQYTDTVARTDGMVESPFGMFEGAYVHALEAVAAAVRNMVGKKPWLEPLTFDAEGEPDLGEAVWVFLPIGRWLAVQDALDVLGGVLAEGANE